MTDVKSLPPPRSSNAIPSSSNSVPPPSSGNIERQVNETSPVYPADPTRYTVTREITDAYRYQSRSASSSWKTFRTILVFSILAIIVTSYLGEKMKNQLIRNRLTWTKITPSKWCIHYRTRAYSALLRGAPNDDNALEWCKEKSISIQGIEFKKPLYCTIDVDRSGTINSYGHWIVTSNEPRCRTVWEDFVDKGCVANVSRYHRVEAQMGNHQMFWDNSLDMCSTTPADYEEHHFDRPDRCDKNLLGSVTGVWFFKDEGC